MKIPVFWDMTPSEWYITSLPVYTMSYYRKMKSLWAGFRQPVIWQTAKLLSLRWLDYRCLDKEINTDFFCNIALEQLIYLRIKSDIKWLTFHATDLYSAIMQVRIKSDMQWFVLTKIQYNTRDWTVNSSQKEKCQWLTTLQVARRINLNDVARCPPVAGSAECTRVCD
jgi:hypothetical protein